MSDTPEAVALRLLELLMQNEKQAEDLRDKDILPARNWLLNTYAECLQAASGARSMSGAKPPVAGAGGPGRAPRGPPGRRPGGAGGGRAGPSTV
jgi:hypothetical protein